MSDPDPAAAAAARRAAPREPHEEPMTLPEKQHSSWAAHSTHAIEGRGCVRCGVSVAEFASTLPCYSQSPVGGVLSLDEARGCTVDELRADIIRRAARGQGPTFIAAKLDFLIAGVSTAQADAAAQALLAVSRDRDELKQALDHVQRAEQAENRLLALRERAEAAEADRARLLREKSELEAEHQRCLTWAETWKRKYDAADVARTRLLAGLQQYGQHTVTCDKGRICGLNGCGRYAEHEVHGHDYHKGYGHEFEPSENCTCGLATLLGEADKGEADV